MMESISFPFIFVSYAHEDLALLLRLQKDIEERGIHLWFDQKLAPGTFDWEEAIRAAMRESLAVVLLASPNARASRYVKDELRIAERYHRKIYPFWIAGKEWIDTVPLGWGGIHYIDARIDYQTALNTLEKSIKNHHLDIPNTQIMQVVSDSEQSAAKLLLTLPFKTDTTLVGRGTLLSQLKKQLCENGTIALSGLPGVGKTALASALIDSHEVHEYFVDGILWANLGIQPYIKEIQSHWGAQLGLSPSELKNIKSCDDWIRTLSVLIGMRSMLLVIDDVWEIDDAMAFQVGGPNCKYLFTTRFPRIAIQIAGNRTIQVSELSEKDGVDLLTHFVPTLIQHDITAAKQLVNSVGALPLALVSMGRYLRSQTYNEQPRRLHNALRDLSNTESRMNLVYPHGLSGPYSNYSHSVHYSLQSAIALSDEHLNDAQAQSMLRILSIFPPKPNTFSEDAAVAISQQPDETLDTLCDIGLIESNSPGRYMMHQTIADYAQSQLEENTQLFERLIAYMTHYIEAHGNDYQAIELEHVNILAALEEAARHGLECEFMQGVIAFAPFLRIRGLHNEARLYLQRGYQVAQKLGNHLEEMKLLSHLGRMSEQQSEDKEADRYLSEGLRLARKYEQPEYICLFLAYLGIVIDRLGEYQQAKTYLQEGLLLARQLDQPERICEVLCSLGIVANHQGNYTSARSILSEALDLARKLEYKEYTLQALTQMGVIAVSQEEHICARTYFLEALDLARQMGYQDLTLQLIANLSRTSEFLGDYQQS